jgi:hypothetical protein
VRSGPDSPVAHQPIASDSQFNCGVSKLSHRRARISLCKFILAMMLGLLAFLLAACGPQGLDYEKWLVLKEDGLIYRIGEDEPYTGKAYCTLGFRGSWLLGYALTWQGEFKAGKKHGTFFFPASRKANDFFFWGGKEVLQVQFRNGIELHNNE